MPAEAGGGDELGRQAAQHEGAGPVAHQQHAGGKALLVRKARHDGGEHAVIHKAHAYARNGEGDEQQPETVGLQEHAQQVAHKAQHAARGDGDAHALPVRHGAAYDAAEAEAAQHDREADAEFCARPAEALHEGRGIDAPGVDHAVYEQHGRAGDEGGASGKALFHAGTSQQLRMSRR